jgi:hypothetical protein
MDDCGTLADGDKQVFAAPTLALSVAIYLTQPEKHKLYKTIIDNRPLCHVNTPAACLPFV